MSLKFETITISGPIENHAVIGKKTDVRLVDLTLQLLLPLYFLLWLPSLADLSAPLHIVRTNKVIVDLFIVFPLMAQCYHIVSH